MSICSSSLSSIHSATLEYVLDSDDSVADKTYEPYYDEDSEGVGSNDDDFFLPPIFDTVTLGNKATREYRAQLKKSLKRKKQPENWGQNLQKKFMK